MPGEQIIIAVRGSHSAVRRVGDCFMTGRTVTLKSGHVTTNTG